MGSNNNGRPSSISNAAKQSLSKQGYAYDGLTLSNLSFIVQIQMLVELQALMGQQIYKELMVETMQD